MQRNQLPIGMFDSGVGGTSILREVNRLMPYEKIIYLADSLYAPYGTKPKQKIVDLSVKNTEKLLQLGVKIIVVACNTATTNAISFLRATYPDISFIGIEPAIKPATLISKNKRIGILATKGTLSSKLFHDTSKKFVDDSIEILEKEGIGLVEAVEANTFDTPEFIQHFQTQLDFFVEKEVDCIVLGCTHYPYLIPLIKSYLPPSIQIIDSGEAVARQTKRILEKANLLHTKLTETKYQIKLYTNTSITTLSSLFAKEIKSSKANVQYLDF